MTEWLEISLKDIVVDIETGLLLTGRGAKAETYFNNGNDYVKAKFNPLYIELPVNLLIKFPMSDDAHLFVNAGPYAAVGVGGKSKFESKLGPLTSNSESNIKFNNIRSTRITYNIMLFTQ